VTASRGLLAFMIGLLAAVDGLGAWLGWTVWTAYHRNGNLEASEAATFTLFGVSAAAGALIQVLVVIALLRGTRGHGLSRIAYGAAVLRPVVVLAALLLIGLRLGGSALVGSIETVGAVIALGEACIGVIPPRIAVRRTGRR
jgi:hypothetical protein